MRGVRLAGLPARTAGTQLLQDHKEGGMWGAKLLTGTGVVSLVKTLTSWGLVTSPAHPFQPLSRPSQ